MLGFVAAMGSEFATGQPVFTQVGVEGCAGEKFEYDMVAAAFSLCAACSFIIIIMIVVVVAVVAVILILPEGAI